MSELRNDHRRIGTSYLEKAFLPDFDSVLKGLAELAEPLNADTVVGMGCSGIYPLRSFVLASGLRPAFLRKEGENSHGTPYTGPAVVERYLILDDLISSGATVETIIRKMKAEQKGAKCVGIVLWGSHHGIGGLWSYALGPKVNLPVISLHDLERRVKR